MGLSINQNIAAFNAYRNLSSTQGSLGKSLEKLSSGFRINRAADDAAGLAISEGLRSQVGGLKVASRNAQDGISVVQTAEGALTETHAILQRMRDLSVQAGNHGGMSADAKKNIQLEMDQLKSEVTRIADTTKFNGAELLKGSYNGTFQVGANVGETISVSVNTNMSAEGLNIANVGVTTDPMKMLGTPTGGTDATAGTRAKVTWTIGTATLTTGVESLTGLGANVALAVNDGAAAIAEKINGTSAAAWTAQVSGSGSGTQIILTQKTAAALTEAPTLAITNSNSGSLANLTATALDTAGVASAAATHATNRFSVADLNTNGGTLNVAGKTVDITAGESYTSIVDKLTTAGSGVFTAAATGSGGEAGQSTHITLTSAGTGTAAQSMAANIKVQGENGTPDQAIKLIDNAIKNVSTLRATLGAVQNRFEHTINNLNVSVENLSASESRIRDTDMASEMVNFTRNQILSQAGTAMLAQANQIPQGVLSLLR